MSVPTPRRRFLRQGLAATLGLGFLGRAPAYPDSPTPPAPPGNAEPQLGPVSSVPTASVPTPVPTSAVSPALAPAPAPRAFAALFERIRREATPEQLYRFLHALPKGGDLHHHLGGGFLPPRWFAVATDRLRNGGQTFYTRTRVLHPTGLATGRYASLPHSAFWMTIREDDYASLSTDERAEFKALPDLDDAERAAWLSSIQLDRPEEGRDEFFEYHWTRLNHLLTSIHVCAELVVENMRLMAAEGARYLELMSGYAGWRDERGRVLPPAEADAFWRARLAQPDARATGVIVRFKALVIRFLPDAEEQTRRHFAHVDSARDLWVGIDMAGREDNNKGHPRRFTAVFDEMLRRYPDIPISIHAGEAEKPDRHIFDSLRLGARRIGHAINLLHDEETLLRLRDRSTLLEINLVSNHLLGYVPDPDQHPFPIYLRHGIPCCLNTDDRGMWDSTFTDEYFVAVRRFHLSWPELVQLGRHSLEHAFLPPEDRAALLADHERALAAFAARFTAENWRAVLAATPAETYGYGARHLGLAALARQLPHAGPLPV
jgi:adenosine deaminase CECR1